VPNEELFIESRCLSSNIISIKILDFSNLCKIIHHSKLRDIEIISSTVHDILKVALNTIIGKGQTLIYTTLQRKQTTEEHENLPNITNMSSIKKIEHFNDICCRELIGRIRGVYIKTRFGLS
jgi:hypothetical protein